MKTMRDMIEIDESLCDGCGVCVPGCAEGALAIVDGKARLVSEVYCDGLGACLGKCPRGALRVVRREAEAFSEEAVRERLRARTPEARTPEARTPEARPAPPPAPLPCGCPGSMSRTLPAGAPRRAREADAPAQPSGLGHWPIQWRLVPPSAPWLAGKNWVVAADCSAFACGDFHRRFLAGNALVVGCPKLDDAAAFADKLAAMLAAHRPEAIEIVRMEVPCCGGLERVVAEAMRRAGVEVPVKVTVLEIGG